MPKWDTAKTADPSATTAPTGSPSATTASLSDSVFPNGFLTGTSGFSTFFYSVSSRRR